MIFRIKHRHLLALLATLVGVLAAWQLGGWETVFRREGSASWLLACGALGGAAALAINAILHGIFCRAIGPAYERAFRRHAEAVLGPMRWPEYLAGGLMAGLAEEPLFRGIVLPAASSLSSSASVGVAAAALLFAACHWLRWEFWPFWIWALWEGILFGLLLVWSGSVLVPMAAHATHDVAAYAALQSILSRPRRA